MTQRQETALAELTRPRVYRRLARRDRRVVDQIEERARRKSSPVLSVEQAGRLETIHRRVCEYTP